MEFITDESLNNRNEQPNKHTNIDNNTLYKKLIQIENEIHHLKTALDNINYIHYPRPLRPYLYAPFPERTTWYSAPFQHSVGNND